MIHIMNNDFPAETKQKEYKILFVCLGNICRSPSAEAIMKKLVKDAGADSSFFIDSAGIIAYHEGEPADPRMKAHAIRRGYVLESISRPITGADFYTFDFIIGMDDRNIEYATNKLYDYIPDPYYSGASGFELVLDLLEDCCQGLLNRLLSS